MKKANILIIASLLTTSVFASKARLLALGEGFNGSYLIEDERSIFFNPAHIMHHKNYVMMEVGDKGAVSATDKSKTDIDNNPIAEGGFVSVSGNSAYGLFLGTESNKASELRVSGLVAAEGATTNYYHQDNITQFHYGKSTGTLDWGAYINYSSTQDEVNNKEQSSSQAGFGVVKGNSEIYTHVGLDNKMKSGSTEFDGKLGVKVGYLQNLESGLKVHAAITQFSFDMSSTNKDPTVDVQEIDLNIGRVKKINEQSNLWISMAINYDTTEAKDALAAGLTALGKGEDNKEITVPFTVAVESLVKEWLTLRASISQNIFGEKDIDGKKTSLDNSTNVNAGAGFHFGDLSIDGLIGTGNNGSGTGITTTTAEKGVLSTDNLMTRVSLTYKF